MAATIVIRSHPSEASPTADLRKVEVFDPMFHQRAYTVTIPKNWVIDASLIRTHFGPSPVFRVSSPDGLTGAQLLPRYDWVATNNRGMQRFYQDLRTVMAPAMPAAQVLTKFVLPEARPGVEVVKTEVAKGAAQQAADYDRNMNAQFEAQAAGSHQRPKHVASDAARIRIRYQLHGHPVEEVLVVTSSVNTLPLLQGGEMQLSMAQVFAARAPVGRLDAMENLIGAIFQSVSMDPAWQAKQNAFALQSAEAKQRAIIATADLYRKRNQAIFNASMKSAAAISGAGHRAAMGTADNMGDVQSMINPSTGQPMKVSNQFNYSYVDENGDVVHTNSATFNPNGQMRGNWTQLQPMKAQ